MYPTIKIAEGGISTFQLCAMLAVLTFVLTVIVKLRKFKNFSNEVFYIVPKLFIALGLGIGGAALFDSVAMYAETGEFKITGIAYYGGFIVGLPSLALMLKLFRKNTTMSVMEWLNFITIPFIAFHCIARFGCFLGGCCYGKPTDGPFGLLFQDVPESGIYHYGQKVLPTNLFESCGLFLIGVILFFFVKKHRFTVYLYSYATLRFILEFWRDDARGANVGALSPSQFVSVLIVCIETVWIVVWYILKRKNIIGAPKPTQAYETSGDKTGVVPRMAEDVSTDARITADVSLQTGETPPDAEISAAVPLGENTSKQST